MFPSKLLPLLLWAAWSILSATAVDDVVVNQMYTYRLPRVHVQFICHQDIRSTFDVVELFDGYYRTILSGVSNTTLRHDLRTSSMRDIPRNKWFYNSCNVSSPQVLLTMETEGWAQYDWDWNGTTSNQPFEDDETFNALIMSSVTPPSLMNYISDNFCKSMEIYRAYVQDWSNLSEESFEHDEYLDHSLILLCGGESYIYYEEEDPSRGFVVFGMLCGVVMAGMIFGELQQLYERPTPTTRRGTTTTTTSSSSTTSSRRSSQRRDRRRVDYALAPIELEMV